jgi:hypothetical protein
MLGSHSYETFPTSYDMYSTFYFDYSFFNGARCEYTTRVRSELLEASIKNIVMNYIKESAG